MALDMVGFRAQVQSPALEEHHVDVHSSVACGHNSLAEPIEEGLVEPVEVEPRLAVSGLPRPRSRPRLRRHAQVEIAGGGLGLELLPAPESDEVVPALLEESEVRVVVELLGLGGAGRARTHPVMQVVPDV
jgi:hypothetical protein